jgi:hypothetical protein
MKYNISHVNNVNDYLYILNGVVLTDMIVISLLLGGFIKSSVLHQWYQKFTLSAFISDVLVIVIGIMIARWVYPFLFKQYSLITFLLLVVGIQMLHDILFYFFSLWVPRGKSRILDIFKDYGKQQGFSAIYGDSLMMISSVLLATWLSSFSMNINIGILIVSIYVAQYLIYSV